MISVVLLVLVFVSALYCVINCMMYLAVMAICQRNDLPVQDPEMEGHWRPDRVAADRRRDVLDGRNRQTNNHSLGTGNRARPQEHDERLF